MSIATENAENENLGNSGIVEDWDDRLISLAFDIEERKEARFDHGHITDAVENFLNLNPNPAIIRAVHYIVREVEIKAWERAERHYSEYPPTRHASSIAA
ncbi:hypothetical protein [Azospirillum sp. TSH64]|uniref:hypothetical protein n=1 Tax=Azospirillum sp. TSH64 TaxID=652740 RepID=UPI000D6088A6|nr:hypothetical protein [Azospirillum sp. TSH64]PWC81264.1 hypothetical protein TSH64_01075 [Azospirillum sp. TSH64]